MRRVDDTNEVAEAVDMYKSGRPLSYIARQLGGTVGTWHRRLLNAGVVMRPRWLRPDVNTESEKRAIRIAKESEQPGVTQVALAKKYGVSRQRIHQLIQRGNNLR